jgi:outer membrane protein OmpA-like peptidoglycan-associated protein
MQTRILAAAILAASASLPATARAAYEYSPQWFVYSVNQVCQVWGNGISRCFPVALVGPPPSYMAPGLQPLMPPAPYPSGMAAATVTPRASTTPAALSPSPSASPSPLPSMTATVSTPVAPSPAEPSPAASDPAPRAAESLSARLEDALTHFDFDSAELTDAGRDTLDDWLSQVPKDIRVRVTGHADRLGSASYNQGLSLRRAQAVMRHLAGKGMRPNDILIAAKGETVPVTHCPGGPTPETVACLAPNRRVEIDPE